MANTSWIDRPIVGDIVIDRGDHAWTVTARQLDSTNCVVGITLGRDEAATPEPTAKSNGDVARDALREIAAAGNPLDRIAAAKVLLTFGGGE